MKVIQLPREIVDSLLTLGSRTEQGQALMAGFRLGHPDLHPDLGEINIVQSSASIEIGSKKKDDIKA